MKRVGLSDLIKYADTGCKITAGAAMWQTDHAEGRSPDSEADWIQTPVWLAPLNRNNIVYGLCISE